MKHWNDSVLTFIAHVSDHLGLASKMLDSVMDRVVTVQTAKACGGYSWYYCDKQSYCIFAYACPGGNQLRLNTYVMGSIGNCGNPQAITCTLDVCWGC